MLLVVVFSSSVRCLEHTSHSAAPQLAPAFNKRLTKYAVYWELAQSCIHTDNDCLPPEHILLTVKQNGTGGLVPGLLKRTVTVT